MHFTSVQFGEESPEFWKHVHLYGRSCCTSDTPVVTFICRHKHIYKQEAVSEDAAQELGDIAVFRPSTWKGPLPRETLSHWCQQNQVSPTHGSPLSAPRT